MKKNKNLIFILFASFLGLSAAADRLSAIDVRPSGSSAIGVAGPGPGGSTDNAIARYNGVNGNIQNSLAILSDSGSITTEGGFYTTNTNPLNLSGNPIGITSVLNPMNGTDEYSGLALNITNANHLGSGNLVYGVNISGITQDAQATETAISIGAGWDVGINAIGNSIVASSFESGGAIFTTGGSFYVDETGYCNLQTLEVETLFSVTKSVGVVQSVTALDNGLGTPQSITLDPSNDFITINCSDPHGCVVTMSEAIAIVGHEFTAYNISTNLVTFQDQAGVSELPSGADFIAGQYDNIKMAYVIDRWVATGITNN